MLGGEGAAIGDDQCIRGKRLMGADQLQLFADAGVSVAIAVVAMEGDG